MTTIKGLGFLFVVFKMLSERSERVFDSSILALRSKARGRKKKNPGRSGRDFFGVKDDFLCKAIHGTRPRDKLFGKCTWLLGRFYQACLTKSGWKVSGFCVRGFTLQECLA